MLMAHAFRLLGFPRRRPPPETPLCVADINWPELDWQFFTSWAGERREISPSFDIGEDDWHEIVDPQTGAQRQIECIDPVYGTRLRLYLCYLKKGDDIRIFAATEVSNGVWIIFVPRDATCGKRVRLERRDDANA